MDEPVKQLISRSAAAGKSICFVLTCAATLLILTEAQDSTRRMKSTGYAIGNIVLVSSPYLSTPICTEQNESQFAAKMTAWFVRQLPLVAATVDSLRVREIAFAQIGGLYGP